MIKGIEGALTVDNLVDIFGYTLAAVVGLIIANGSIKMTSTISVRIGGGWG